MKLNNKGEVAVVGFTLWLWLAIAGLIGVGVYNTENGTALASKQKPASDSYWAEHGIFRPYTK